MSTHRPAPSHTTHVSGRRTIPAALAVGALGVAAAAALAARTRRGHSFDPLEPQTWPPDTLAYSG